MDYVVCCKQKVSKRQVPKIEPVSIVFQVSQATEKWMSRRSIIIKKILRVSYEKEVANFEIYEFSFTTKENLGRTKNTSPKQGEQYYLRLMLT